MSDGTVITQPEQLHTLFRVYKTYRDFNVEETTNQNISI